MVTSSPHLMITCRVIIPALLYLWVFETIQSNIPAFYGIWNWSGGRTCFDVLLCHIILDWRYETGCFIIPYFGSEIPQIFKRNLIGCSESSLIIKCDTIRRLSVSGFYVCLTIHFIDNCPYFIVSLFLNRFLVKVLNVMEISTSIPATQDCSIA